MEATTAAAAPRPTVLVKVRKPAGEILNGDHFRVDGELVRVEAVSDGNGWTEAYLAGRSEPIGLPSTSEVTVYVVAAQPAELLPTPMWIPPAEVIPNRSGRWSRRMRPERGQFAVSLTAAEIAAELGAEGIYWESFGHVNGQERFGFQYARTDAEGRLHVYTEEGHKVVIHPADRRRRVLRQRA